MTTGDVAPDACNCPGSLTTAYDVTGELVIGEPVVAFTYTCGSERAKYTSTCPLPSASATAAADAKPNEAFDQALDQALEGPKARHRRPTEVVAPPLASRSAIGAKGEDFVGRGGGGEDGDIKPLTP